jgi:hypothetical protein
MTPSTRLLLLVPLMWASCGLAQSAAEPTSAAPGWQQSQHRDAADTYTFTRFILVGKFLTAPADKLADRPALRVDCIPPGGSHRSRFLAADLLVGTPLKIVYVEPEEIRGTNYFPKIAVRYRTDDAREDEQRWPAGTDVVPTAKPSDKSSATVPADALKRMLRAHIVAITVNSDRGSPLAMQFDMPNPAPIEAACRVE